MFVNTVSTQDTIAYISIKEEEKHVIEIDLKSRTPIYEQLIQRVKLLMAQDILQPGDQLPSVRQLAGDLTVNPNTIQKAYRELEREGYVYSLPGKGSFVNDMKETINREKVTQLKSELERILNELSLLNVSKQELISWIESVDIPGSNTTPERSDGNEDIN